MQGECSSEEYSPPIIFWSYHGEWGVRAQGALAGGVLREYSLPSRRQRGVLAEGALAGGVLPTGYPKVEGSLGEYSWINLQKLRGQFPPFLRALYFQSPYYTSRIPVPLESLLQSSYFLKVLTPEIATSSKILSTHFTTLFSLPIKFLDYSII